MKPVLRSLRPGQTVWAVVDEVIALGEIVVNFNGDLLRVKNESDRIFRVGTRIRLQVESVYPLAFKVLSNKPRSPRGFEISI